jgi:DNA-binding CsgD family transcriptional regulator
MHDFEAPADPPQKVPIAAVLQAASAIPHTDYVIGRGIRKDDGGIRITEHHVSPGLGDAFVEGYAEVEPFDSAAQQFLCMPFIPIAIEVGKVVYTDDASKQSGKMADYLRGFNIDSLLIVGLESRMGLCWMTLYRRRKPSNPFTAEDAELASYRIRAALFDWQLVTKSPVLERPALDRYKLLPLGRRALDVAVRRVRGMTRAEIAVELGITDAAVDEHLKRLKKLKLDKKTLADRFLGKLISPRPLAKDESKGR